MGFRVLSGVCRNAAGDDGDAAHGCCGALVGSVVCAGNAPAHSWGVSVCFVGSAMNG